MAKKRANGEGNVRKRTDGTQGVGQAVDPHFDPHLKVHFCNEKHPKSEDFRCFLELLTRFELVTSSLPNETNYLNI